MKMTVVPTGTVAISALTEPTAMSWMAAPAHSPPAFTLRMRSALLASPPPMAVMVTLYVPRAKVLARLTVRVVLLSNDVKPVDSELMLMVTVPVNGGMAVSVTVDVTDVPGPAHSTELGFKVTMNLVGVLSKLAVCTYGTGTGVVVPSFRSRQSVPWLELAVGQPVWKLIGMGNEVVPMMLKMAVNRRPVVGGTVVPVPDTANSSVPAWLRAPGARQVLPCMRWPSMHLPSTVIWPGTIVPVKLMLVGWSIVGSAVRATSNPCRAVVF